MCGRFFLLLTCFSLPLWCANKEDMKRDLEFKQAIFELKYAPMEWKKKHINWALAEEIGKARQQIERSSLVTVKEYQKILRAFFQSFSDYHVGVIFHSTEKAMLPFSVQNADNKYFVTESYTELIELMREMGGYEGKELLSTGCQLLRFDGVPIEKVIAEIKKEYLSQSFTPTAQHIANQILTLRLGQLGHMMPKPYATLKFRTPAGKLATAQIDWIHMPEEIFYKSPVAFEMWENKDASKKYMLAPLAMTLQKEKVVAYRKCMQRYANVAPSAKVPAFAPRLLLGNVLWQEKEPSIFQAYIYESPQLKKKIGYLRIATYMPSEDEAVVSQLIEDLAVHIRYLEENSDALVVDQVDNGGGLVFYAYAIAALLTDRPLNVPWHSMTLTQKEVLENIRSIEAIEQLLENPDLKTKYQFGYPCDQLFYTNALEFSRFILSEWQQGNLLTGSCPLYGIAKLYPHPMGSYSHPLLVLINGNDFSGADFIPAILQDNQRAKLFGEQTAGAGGCVELCSYPNLFGEALFSYTSSYALRENGNPIENLGVQPDIPCQLSVADLMHDNIDYKQAVNQAVEQLLSN